MEAAQAAEAPVPQQPAVAQPRQPVVIPALGVKKGRPMLMPERFGLAEHRRQEFVANLPMDITIDDAREPGYWAHVADQMQPMDHIELRAEDGSWVAELIVAFCDRNYAKVVLKSFTRLDEDQVAPAQSIKLKVEWKGPQLKYAVIRTSDSQILRSDMRTRDEATQWMTAHEKVMER